MTRRPLGKTGIHVSEVAFGGVEIGMPYGIGVAGKEDMLPEQEAIYLIHQAVDSGINFFDTARMYGNSEYIMGRAFRDRRQEVVLCTKCTHLRSPEGRLVENMEATIRASLSESLEALQTDYVDVFMLHSADMEILEREEVVRIFSELKASGVVRATGASTYLPEETRKVLDSGWDVVQLPFNLLDQRQQACFSSAAAKGVGIVVRSVLLKGLLSEKGRNLHAALSGVESHIKTYHSLLDEAVPNLPALATKFALSFDEVSAVLVGIDRLEYLHQSLEAANGAYLGEAVRERARALAYPDPAFLNLHTWSQMGWLK